MTEELRGHTCVCAHKDRDIHTQTHKHTHIKERIPPEQMCIPSAHTSLAKRPQLGYQPSQAPSRPASAATQLATRPHPARHLTLPATLPTRRRCSVAAVTCESLCPSLPLFPLHPPFFFYTIRLLSLHPSLLFFKR